MSEQKSPKEASENWVSASTIRAQLVLEMAAGMVAIEDQPMRQANIQIREKDANTWPVSLFGNSTMEGLNAVIDGTATLSMINPAAILTMAHRGTGIFTAPQPVRMIGVIPSFDQLVFAVNSDSGITNLEDIGAKKYPLRMLLRDPPNHCIHIMVEHILAAAGFSIDDIKSWGGNVDYAVRPGKPRFGAIEAGTADAIFDEAVQEWVEDAIDAGMNILSLREETVVKLEAIGYRRGIISKSLYPKLPHDILTIDFSGWPIYVLEKTPDDLVHTICKALDARRDLIPWQGEGALPVARMCRDAPDTPLDVPLHDAAEAYWRECGYLD